MKYSNTISVLFLMLCSSFSYGQSLERTVVASGGQDQKSGNLNISSTIGESVVTTSKKSTLIITQGFQQSTEEGGDNNSISYEKANSLDISLFPNPTQEWVKVKSKIERELHLTVLDGLGKVVYEEIISMSPSAENRIEVSTWAVGQYFFNFYEEGSEKKSSFKMLKQ